MISELQDAAWSLEQTSSEGLQQMQGEQHSGDLCFGRPVLKGPLVKEARAAWPLAFWWSPELLMLASGLVCLGQ